ncbi:hypothetical protein BATDEDRAFT_26319 [Batrachochytrium dendrobatidis JAM81]|uniref:Uncharacterized protein n=1 Tax=Batrachochytrium dendrobatidis (strain JAM81 / FGSC 10211) TaxID=684364 RepID=F4P6V4_BATDJ|nr:uncharacterized protein BATDEDRAFT_26319 [Batrachochytrium dendrobatidis JAM81]EGF79102.1 hypothetical protein BATDEDRAFT_26319 [Batrachochytrium dendrobatidis JAM81]|eukprot:XP_006680359.1 hypothetical protein BATDEDRAFT_26319 [Batrachochytrium dendrobatidis JAM81]
MYLMHHLLSNHQVTAKAELSSSKPLFHYNFVHLKPSMKTHVAKTVYVLTYLHLATIGRIHSATGVSADFDYLLIYSAKVEWDDKMQIANKKCSIAIKSWQVHGFTLRYKVSTVFRPDRSSRSHQDPVNPGGLATALFSKSDTNRNESLSLFHRSMHALQLLSVVGIDISMGLGLE